MKTTTNRVGALGQYFTIPTMAEALGVTPRALEVWVRAHDVKVTKMGATVLVTLDDLSGYRARIANVRKLLEAGQA